MRPGLTVVLFFAFKSGGRGGRGTEEVECEHFLVFCLACFELYTLTQTSAPHKCAAWPSGLGSAHMHRAWKDKNVKRSMGPKQIWPKGEAERRRRGLPPFATSALPSIKTIMPNTAPVHEIHLDPQACLVRLYDPVRNLRADRPLRFTPAHFGVPRRQATKPGKKCCVTAPKHGQPLLRLLLAPTLLLLLLLICFIEILAWHCRLSLHPFSDHHHHPQHHQHHSLVITVVGIAQEFPTAAARTLHSSSSRSFATHT